MTPERFRLFLDHLAHAARDLPDVRGLVAFGSTAARARADDGSDHDFAWIVEPGAEDRYRRDLGWLPEAERIVASAVEHHGGVKALYDDGHRIEFGVADVAAFSTWAGAPVEVLVGDRGVRDAARAVAANRPEGERDAAREFTLFLTQLLSGIGRARRGEVQSASGLIRYEAVNHLLYALAARFAPGNALLDPLDPRRRFDAVLPALGARIEDASVLPPLAAAEALLAIAESELEVDPHAARAIAAARSRLP
jgi:hypothetical protein